MAPVIGVIQVKLVGRSVIVRQLSRSSFRSFSYTYLVLLLPIRPGNPVFIVRLQVSVFGGCWIRSQQRPVCQVYAVLNITVPVQILQPVLDGVQHIYQHVGREISGLLKTFRLNHDTGNILPDQSIDGLVHLNTQFSSAVSAIVLPPCSGT